MDGNTGAYETNVQYDYVGKTSQNLGNGQNGRIDEQYLDVRQTFMRHTLLVFLAEGGSNISTWASTHLRERWSPIGLIRLWPTSRSTHTGRKRTFCISKGGLDLYRLSRSGLECD